MGTVVPSDEMKNVNILIDLGWMFVSSTESDGWGL